VPSGLTSGAGGSLAWIAPDGAGGWGVDGTCEWTIPAGGEEPWPLAGVDPAATVLSTTSENACGRAWRGPGASGHAEGWLAWIELACSGPSSCVPSLRSRRAGTDPTAEVTGLGFDPPWVAVAERVGQGPATLRVQQLPSTLGDPLGAVGGPLNRDLAHGAESPAVNYSRVVAWLEDGVALARLPLDGGGWSAPLVLNADEAHPARALTLGHSWIAWVERHPDGDHIALRTIDFQGGQLLAYPDLVPGHDVASLTVSGDSFPLVAWRDPAGAIRIRAPNH
jgi:hypothetical protein